MLTNTAIAIFCGVLIFAGYIAAISWTIYNLKKQEINE